MKAGNKKADFTQPFNCFKFKKIRWFYQGFDTLNSKDVNTVISLKSFN